MVSPHQWYHEKCIDFRDSKLYFKPELLHYGRNTYKTTGMNTLQKFLVLLINSRIFSWLILEKLGAGITARLVKLPVLLRTSEL